MERLSGRRARQQAGGGWEKSGSLLREKVYTYPLLSEIDDFPAGLKDKVTSLLIETGSFFDLRETLEAICVAVLSRIRTLEQHGFAPILEQWQKRDFLRGTSLQWVTNSGEIIAGYSEEVDENGRLLVRDGQGKLHAVVTGDVSVAAKWQK